MKRVPEFHTLCMWAEMRPGGGGLSSIGYKSLRALCVTPRPLKYFFPRTLLYSIRPHLTLFIRIHCALLLYDNNIHTWAGEPSISWRSMNGQCLGDRRR